MTNDLFYLIASRCVERLAIIVIAGMSLYFGWALFKRNLESQEAELSTGVLTVKFARVAPGVFFALFGALILIYSITQPLEITPVSSAEGIATGQVQAPREQDPDARTPSIHYLNGLEKGAVVKAINTLNSTVATNPEVQLRPYMNVANARAFGVLEDIKKAALLEEFGPDAVAKYNKYRVSPTQDTASQFTKDEMAKIQIVIDASSQSYLDVAANE